MEIRKITVSNTKTQETKVVETAATTLKELKEAFRQAGIDYTDMAFYEGLTKVELIDDDSLLPHDVSYKGIITNDLVIMLTNMKGKIASGCISRKDIYAYIKEQNLQEEAYKYFGKNFTNVSTAELADWLCENDEEEKEEVKEDTTIKLNFPKLSDAVTFAADFLHKVAELMNKHLERDEEEKTESPYTKDELNKMTDWLKSL